MSVKKDYVLQIARVLLLDPLTMDFKTYDEANKYFAVCECLWVGLDKEHFPGLDLLKETLKNLSIESQHPGVEGLSIAFMYNLMKKGKKDDKDVYRAWVKNLTAHYTSVCDMDKDFNGEPWDETPLTNEERDQVKVLFETISSQNKTIELLQQENTELKQKKQIPGYAQVLVGENLFIQEDNYIYPYVETFFKGKKGVWYEAVKEALNNAHIKPNWAEWSSETGCIRKKDGSLYAKNSFAPNRLKTKK